VASSNEVIGNGCGAIHHIGNFVRTVGNALGVVLRRNGIFPENGLG
jgi:hypothetical protein